MSEDLAVFTAAEEAARAGRPVVLATIVRCRGSTPRGIGSKMLVDPERGLTGTVGGGCGEAEVIEAAREVVLTGEPRMVHVDLTEDLLSWSPAVCGGTFDVFLERARSRHGNNSLRRARITLARCSPAANCPSKVATSWENLSSKGAASSSISRAPTYRPGVSTC